MITKEKPSPGKLITLRGREWIVLPTDDEEILKVKPLGGSEDEATGIYLPLFYNGKSDEGSDEGG